MKYSINSKQVICVHNHPSGDASPSNNDIDITRKIKDIGNMHGIVLIDHIIIGDNNYYSFFEDDNL